MNPTGRLAREIAREASFLSERDRLWLFERLRKDYQAYDKEQHRIDRLNQKMNEAVQALERVAGHLKLTNEAALTSLTMDQFDAAPERIRKDWTAGKVAEPMRRSWQFAKGVAFGNERLPVIQEHQWQLSKELNRKRRESAFALGGLQDWLATNPGEKTRAAYEQWRRNHNQHERAGLKPLPGQEAIRERWSCSWAECVKAVEEGREPGHQEDEDAAEKPPAKRSGPQAATKPRRYILDSDLRARRLRNAREAKGLTINQVAQQVGLSRSHLGKIESGVAKQTTFETMVKLAEALDLTLDDFVAVSN